MTVRKIVLYVIVFISGAVVLSLEILASRILQPTFGSTVFVWGSLIAVFMAGLAVGYYLGGQLSDRNATFVDFGLLLLLSAVLVANIPVFSAQVNKAIFNSLEDTVERTGPLLASLVLFFIPTAALGIVSPYAVRLLADDPLKLGRQVGSLYALSTVGSIVGTLGTTFYLILWLQMPIAIFLLGAIQSVLAFVAVGYGLANPPMTK